MSVFPENMDPDLLVAFLSNETNPEVSSLVKEWIATSAENQARFEALEKIWNASATAFPQTNEFDTDKAWQNLSAKIEKFETEKIQPGKRQETPTLFLKYTLRAAAVFIPLFIAGYLLFSHYSKPVLLSFSTSTTTVEKTLSDGSIIRLNTNSKLEYPEKFSKTSREVSLTGEAFFRVKPDNEKPFIVRSGAVDVRVVGTSFNVSASAISATIEVFVEEGKVILFALNPDGVKTDSIFLEAGSKGIFEKCTSILRKISHSDQNDLFWINKTLIFDKTPLETVFLAIERKYDARIVLKNNEIKNLRLTTNFVEQPIDSVMNVIAESFKLKIARTGSIFEIDGPE